MDLSLFDRIAEHDIVVLTDGQAGGYTRIFREHIRRSTPAETPVMYWAITETFRTNGCIVLLGTFWGLDEKAYNEVVKWMESGNVPVYDLTMYNFKTIRQALTQWTQR